MATAFGRTLTNVTTARVSMRSLVSIVEKRTVVRARDLYRSGIHPEALNRALRRGLFLKIGRGLYARKDFSADLCRIPALVTRSSCTRYQGTSFKEFSRLGMIRTTGPFQNTEAGASFQCMPAGYHLVSGSPLLL